MALALVVSVVGVAIICGGLLLACCVDPDELTLWGRLARLLTHSLPAGLESLAKLLRVWWICRGVAWAVNFFVNERHPIIQILYVVLVFGGYGAFFVKGYPLLPNPYFSAIHKYIGFVIFVLCVVTFALTSFTDPGVITDANISEYKAIFPYDNFMYRDKVCTTCNLSKVARSKHCRYLKGCVAKYDHYCIWMNNTIGYRNYRWFLAYLVCNSVLMIYGVVAGATIFLTEIDEKRLFEATFVNSITNERLPASSAVLVNYFLHHFLELVFVSILCAVMGTVVSGFTLYNLTLALFNTTANEVGKWREYQEWHDSAVKLHKRVNAARAAGKPLPPPPHVVACETGKCGHTVHEVNKGKPAPTEWDVPEPRPVPANLYSRGWLRNLREVAFPQKVSAGGKGTAKRGRGKRE